MAAAALAMAEQVLSEAHAAAGVPSSAGERRLATLTPHHRELLAELIQARLALRRYGVNVNPGRGPRSRRRDRAGVA